jgi:colanic acid biosynthesis glycosyl transferase WcaI
MNILIITQYFWPENFRINDLAVSLSGRGHQVTVLTGTPNYPEGKFFKGFGWFKKNTDVYKGVKICRVPIIPRGQGSKILLTFNYISFVISASIFGPIFCRQKADLIFVFEPSPITVAIPAILLKKIKKAPLFFWVQDLWPETLSAVNIVSKGNPIYKLMTKLVKSIYSKCDRILVQSRAFEESIRKHISKEKPLFYFPNCAEKLYQPVPINIKSPENNEMPKGFRVMFAGNIGFAQDFETILTAANLLKDYHEIKWVIIGDGRARSWAEEKLTNIGLSDAFHFIGKHPVEKMPIYFSYADVMLVTLKKDPIFALTIPAKIQSYLACSKPIIAGLDGEGARIAHESGAGLACNSENPQALAEIVLEMYNMPENQRKQMGNSGRKYFEENFESDMLVSRLESWMLDEINNRLVNHEVNPSPSIKALNDKK